MYSADHFKVEELATLTAFMQRHGFATIVTHDGHIPHATYMPVLYEPARGPQGMLVSHLARANPQWRHCENGQDVLVIFQGPHASVSLIDTLLAVKQFLRPRHRMSRPRTPCWS